VSLHDIRLSTRITVSALLLVAAGTVGLMLNENARLHQAYLDERAADLTEALRTANVRLRQTIDTLRQDTLFLSNTPPVGGIIRATQNRGHDARYNHNIQVWKELLQQGFATFSRAHPAYYQIRYIGIAENGREIVRINNQAGKIAIAHPDMLRATAERDYFNAALHLREGQVHISEFNLKQPWNGTDPALAPTLRAVAPVLDSDGTLFGMVVVSAHAGELLKSARSGLPPGVETYITNSDGHYLLHSGQHHSAASGADGMANITTDFPLLTPMFDLQRPGHLPLQATASGRGGYLTAERIHFDPENPARFLLLGYHLPEATVASQALLIPAWHVSGGFVAMLVLGAIVLLALRRMFAPLEEIAAAAARITAGERNLCIPQVGGGEIGSLAGALDTMLNRLSQREQEILRLNTELEHRVEQRTREISVANENLLEEIQRREQVQHNTMMLLRRNQLLMDTSMEGIHIMDIQGNIIAANEAFCRMLGYTHAEVLRMNVADWDAQSSAQELRDQFQSFIGHSGLFETVHRRRDGSLIHVEISAAGEKIDGQGYVFAASRDVTDRKQAEAVLRRYKKVIDTTVDGFWAIDMQGRLVEVNEAYARMSGYTADELTRMHISQLDANESPDEIAAHIARIMAQGHDRFETRHRHKDGHEIDVEISTTFMPDQKLFFVFCHDISERKQAERNLSEAKEAAEQANRIKSLFLANMSHEIRTPLNGIIGLARLLEDASLIPRERHYVSKIQSSAQLLLRILNDILDFSRIEAGAIQLEHAPFSLHEVINDIAVLVAPARGKNIEVLFDIAADVPTALVGDALHLQQILLNLASNAVKFTDAGEVVIAISKVADAGTRVTLEFAVRDTGIGIAPEQRQHLFKAFSQAEHNINRRYGGSGLGLAICARLAKLMGGDISFRSQPQQGSEFRLTVAFERAAEGTVPLLALGRLAGLRVLVVDDNATTRQVLMRTCASLHWQPTAAPSAQAALDYLRRANGDAEELDIMLLDWHMPACDGLEMLSRAYADPEVMLPLVILMTPTSDLARLAAVSDQYHLDGSLAKPFTPGTLFETVLRVNEGELTHALPPSTLGRQIPNLHVLVVEDNEINQMVLQNILARAGVRVEVAADGVEAVEILRNHGDAFDVVLMDIRMPRMDGYQATRAIREELGLATLPIIAVSASALPADREHARRAGMNGHIAKPVDNEELLNTLAAYAPLAATRPLFTAPALETAAPEPLPGIDLDKGLANLGGNRGKLIDLLGLLLDDHGADILKAQQLMTAGDSVAAATLMHSLRGAAGYLGANEVWRLATTAEEAIKRDDTAGLASLRSEFDAAFRLIASSIGRRVDPVTARQ